MMTSDRGVLPASMALASSISAMKVDTPLTDLHEIEMMTTMIRS